MDDLKQFRVGCEKRVRRLERFKKTRSFCSLDQETNQENDASDGQSSCLFLPSSSSHSGSDEDVARDDPFELIKEKMIGLMEDDVSLLQQLMTLTEKISEVKQGRGLLTRSQSHTSFQDEDADEEEDHFDDDVSSSRFASSASAVTTVYLNEEDESPQYFSRKNSVLRIPIPPRASNRINRRPSDMSRHSRTLRVDSLPSPLAPSLPSPFLRPSSLSSPSSTLSSTVSSASSTVSSASGVKIIQRGSSSDSGRASDSSHSSSPSPTFE